MGKRRYIFIAIMTLLIFETYSQVNTVSNLISMLNGDPSGAQEREGFNRLTSYANNGNIEAMEFLGCRVVFGRRGFSDIEKGVEYLKSASKEGSSSANWCLAKFYYDNLEIENYIKSIRSCSNSNDPACLYELGIFLLDGKSVAFGSTSTDKYVKYTNLVEALACLKESSDLGNVSASFRLGRLYYFGKLVNKDYKLSKYYFQKCLDDPNFDQQDYILEILDKL